MSMREFIITTMMGLLTGASVLVTGWSVIHGDWLLALLGVLCVVIFASLIFRKEGESL